MGAKKKGKQNKLAKMSDEERLRYLQHKATQEEEARRRKQQLVATFVKVKLKREDAFTRINQAKLHEHWRHILRKSKCTEIRQELERTRQMFEYMLARKEKAIDALQKELQEAETQHLLVIQAHVEDVDRKILFGSKRVEEKFAHFEAQRRILLDVSRSEAEEEKRRGDRALQFLNAVLFATQQNAESTKAGIKQKAKHRRTHTIHSYMEEVQALQGRLQTHQETLRAQLHGVFSSYHLATLDQRRMYEEMKERDSENLKVIENQAKTIAALQADEEKLQRALAKAELTPRTQKLQLQEKQLSLECWKHRKRQQNVTRVDEMQMRQITVAAQHLVEILEKLVQKGENVMKFAQLCNRLETEEEKIIVGQKPASQREDDAADESDLAGGEVMRHFWRRHCQALLSRVALRMHHDSLLAENTKMRSSLKHYLSSASLQASSNLSSGHLMLAKHIRGRRIPVQPH